MYLKDLQKRLIPIYNLTRKAVLFKWTDEHQKIFEGLKKDIANPPVLVMQNNKGHFTLVSNTRLRLVLCNPNFVWSRIIGVLI